MIINNLQPFSLIKHFQNRIDKPIYHTHYIEINLLMPETFIMPSNFEMQPKIGSHRLPTHRRGAHRLPTHRRGAHRLPTHRHGAHRLPTHRRGAHRKFFFLIPSLFKNEILIIR